MAEGLPIRQEDRIAEGGEGNGPPAPEDPANIEMTVQEKANALYNKEQNEVVSQAAGRGPVKDQKPDIGIHQEAITRVFIDRNRDFSAVLSMIKAQTPKVGASAVAKMMEEFRFGIGVPALTLNNQEEYDEIAALNVWGQWLTRTLWSLSS